MLNNWSGGNNGLIIGDLNLDHATWNQPDPGHLRMVERTKLEVETIGFVQLIRNVTRSWPNVDDSLVDHIWTNVPDRVIGHSNEVRAGSDHNAISTVIRTKDRNVQRQEVLKRSTKQMNVQRVKDRVRSIDWTDIYQSKDINVVNHILESRLLEVLNEEAPLKVTQI